MQLKIVLQKHEFMKNFSLDLKLLHRTVMSMDATRPVALVLLDLQLL